LIPSGEEPTYDSDEILDDRLQLIFTCFHQVLAVETQVTLTLQMLGGLETDEIAPRFSSPRQQ
jgi:RNA polymerase sigma-70 factor (ECF subfamily)